MTVIHFVRHGEVHNPNQIFYARLPRFHLNEAGIEQATSAAEYLKKRPIAAVFSSPLLRARQTAQIIAAELGTRVHQSKLLIEINSPYQGRPHAEMEAIGWNIYTDIPDEFDQPEDLMARLQKFACRMRKRFPNQEIVAVTHGDIVLTAQAWGRGEPLTHLSIRRIHPYPATASINTLTFSNGTDNPKLSYHKPY